MLITGTKTLLPELIWSQSQTRRQRLDCRTSAGVVVINLPSIESLTEIKAEGVAFVVNDYDNNAGTNSITVNAVDGDEIDIEGTSSVVISENGASIVLGIGTEGKWIALESTGGSGGSEYTYFERTITSAEIKTLGSNPLILLPAIADLRYIIRDFIFEYTYDGANVYTTGDTLVFSGYEANLSTLIGQAFNSTWMEDNARKFQLGGSVFGFPVSVFTDEETNPSGDATGEMILKFWYRTDTKGLAT